MVHGTASFCYQMQGHIIPKLSIQLNHHTIDSIDIHSTDSTLYILFNMHCKESKFDDKTKKDCQEFCKAIADNLSLKLSTCIDKLKYEGSTFKNANIISCEINEVIYCTSIFEGTVEHGNTSTLEISNFISNNINNNGLLASLFNNALCIKHEATQFLLLYLILLTLNNDSQADVDKFIKIKDNRAKITEKPKQKNSKKPQKTETIFTRLRNELAHKRDDVDTNNTLKEISENLNSLRQITREAIFEILEEQTDNAT